MQRSLLSGRLWLMFFMVLFCSLWEAGCGGGGGYQVSADANQFPNWDKQGPPAQPYAMISLAETQKIVVNDFGDQGSVMMRIDEITGPGVALKRENPIQWTNWSPTGAIYDNVVVRPGEYNVKITAECTLYNRKGEPQIYQLGDQTTVNINDGDEAVISVDLARYQQAIEACKKKAIVKHFLLDGQIKKGGAKENFAKAAARKKAQ